MNGKTTVSLYWLKKTAIYAVSLVFFSAKCFAGLGLPPVIAVQPLGLSVQKGGTAVITTTAVSLTSMTLTWQFNGKGLASSANLNIVNVDTPAGTVSTLTILGINKSDQGTYRVVVTNAVGNVTSQNASVIVLSDVITGVLTNVNILASSMTPTGYQLNLLKPATSNCVIDASTDLKNWTPITTNSSSSTNISFTDPASTSMTFRYYRARLQ